LRFLGLLARGIEVALQAVDPVVQRVGPRVGEVPALLGPIGARVRRGFPRMGCHQFVTKGLNRQRDAPCIVPGIGPV
jgi:hypothetical protein